MSNVGETTLLREPADGGPRLPASQPAPTPGRTTGGRPTRRRRSAISPPWWFLAPAVVSYAFIVIVPSLRGAFFSFTSWDGLTPSWEWVGLDNFVCAFDDSTARSALINTLLLAAAVTILQNVIGLALALGLNTKVKSRYVLRVIFFTPVVVTPLVAGYVWSFLLSPEGTVNLLLQSIGLGQLSHDWLGDPKTALWAIVVEILWQNAGYTMVIYLAGLQAIPEETLEAATIDGAGSWAKFRSIILPLLNSAVVINVVLCLIGSLKQFDQVMAMTSGGPGHATETLSTAIYKMAFQLNDYPKSISLGLIMAVLVAVLASVQYRLTSRKV